MEVSVIMPCLNEEKTIGRCVRKALGVLHENNIEGEVIVSDNGSTDGSVNIARAEGARIVLQNLKGYGRAYQSGMSDAKGKYIIIGDSDDTYDFQCILKFIEPLKEGYEFVNGSRIKGRIHDGAMPFLHRYVGNPMLSSIINLIFKTGFSDVYCGMKSFTRSAYMRLNPVSPGMEYALELVINASILGLKRTEVPVDLSLRKGKSKLRTFRDGWRSLRFIMIYLPDYLFLVPGGLIFFMGFIGMLLLAKGPFTFLNHTFDFHALIFSSMSVLLGFQLINFGFFAKSYALTEGFLTKSTFLRNFYQYFDLKKGVLLGSILVISGTFLSFLIIKKWFSLGAVNEERQELLALTVIIIGVQTIFSSILISLIGLKNTNAENR